MRVTKLLAGTLALVWQSAVAFPPDVKPFEAFQPGKSIVQANSEVNTDYRLFRRAVKAESQKLALKNLSESDSRNEVRIWVGFGLITPRCFILKREGGSDSATYYSTEPDPAATARARKTSLVTLTLKSPKSGWNDFEAFLKAKGVDSTIKLIADVDYSADPDSEAIVIEVKSHAGYNMVFFPADTKSPDGRKAIEVCHKIESEFNVRMGC